MYTPDYFNEVALSPKNSFITWAGNFTKWTEQFVCEGEKNVLVGYSLGGRLALHALGHAPNLWSKVVMVSVNPGFDDMFESFDPSSDERRQRWLTDSYWAEEFLKAPWETVLHGWNAQPVFGGSREEPVRLEKDYSREMLSLALTQWSLAQQKNMRPLMKEHAKKILCLVGDQDTKFVELARNLKEDITALEVETLAEASHRALFDNPQGLGSVISKEL